MAARPNTTGGAAALPLALLEQAIPSLTRDELAALAERVIDRLDEIDGDPDEEQPDVEDSFVITWQARANSTGPGCPIADCDHGVEDLPHDEDSFLFASYGVDQSQPRFKH